jgi:hypothetical protein
VVPPVFVPECGPPDGAPWGPLGLMPSYRPSKGAYAPATGQPHSFFSSSVALHGDCAQADRHASRTHSPRTWGYGHSTILPHNPYKGERDMQNNMAWMDPLLVRAAQRRWMWTSVWRMRRTCSMGALSYPRTIGIDCAKPRYRALALWMQQH